MLVETKYGYIKDKDENIVSKFELPKGSHPLKDEYSFVEVATKRELEEIEIYSPPLSSEIIRENKIKKEMWVLGREQAIRSLKDKGEIE